MTDREFFILLLLITLVFMHLTKMLETYVNSGLPTNDDITSTITTAMNYNDSVVSKIPNYPNNLSNIFDDELRMQELRTFKPSIDGANEKPELYGKEGFTMMNPINLNH